MCIEMDSTGGRGDGVEWSGVEGTGVEWRGGEGRAGQGRVPDCLGGLSRVGISSRSTRPWNGQPPSIVYDVERLFVNVITSCFNISVLPFRYISHLLTRHVSVLEKYRHFPFTETDSTFSQRGW